MSLEDKKGINRNVICYICLRCYKLPNRTVTSKKCKGYDSKHRHTLFPSDLPKKSDGNSNTKISESSASNHNQKTKSAKSGGIKEEKTPTSLCTSVCGHVNCRISCGKTILAKITDL